MCKASIQFCQHEQLRKPIALLKQEQLRNGMASFFSIWSLYTGFNGRREVMGKGRGA